MTFPRIGLRPLAYRAYSTPYWVNDDFLTAAAAPLTSPRSAEPGPGQLTIRDNANRWSINSSNELVPNEDNNGSIDPGIWENNGFTRTNGKTFIVSMKRVSAFGTDGNKLISPASMWATAAGTQSIANMRGLCFNSVANTFLVFPDQVAVPFVYLSDVYYRFIDVMRSSGQFEFVNEQLVWVDLNNTTTPMYPEAGGISADRHPPAIDYFKVRDLGAPFDTDYGIASHRITAFTQSAGANQILNGDFAGGTTTNWTQSGTPTTFDASTGRLRVVTDAAAEGAISNIFVNTQGWGEFLFDLDVISGTVSSEVTNTAGITYFAALTGNRSYQLLGNISGTSRGARFRTIATGEFFVDNVVFRPLTQNAIQTTNPNSIFDAEITLPVSPVAGQIFNLVFREVAPGSNWVAYFRRNADNSAWDFRVDLYIGYVSVTSILNVTGVGTPDMIRVIANGQFLDFYTRNASDGAWTKRGAQQTNFTHATGTGAYLAYSSAMTPTAMTVYPIVSQIAAAPTINLTSFDQSIGSDLTTNGSFANWTGDNPNNWTVSGEVGADPEITQRAPGNTHAGAVGVGGAANFFSSATANAPFLFQARGTAGALFEVEATISAFASGILRFQDAAGAAATTRIFTGSARTFRALLKATSGNQPLVVRTSTAPSDYTIDSVSLKQITLTTSLVAAAQGRFELAVPLPGTTFAGMEQQIRYRVQNESNYFVLRLHRNETDSAWDIQLARVANDSVTSLGTVANVGTIDTLRVTVINDVHNVETLNAGVPTWRIGVLDTTLNTQTGLTEVHNTGFSPTALRFYPVESIYSALSAA